MIFGTNSNYMLKYQKAKAKLVEYDISQKDYPKFPLNSNELSYPVIYILSRYAESIIENDETGKAEFAPYMVKASQYFDASVGANDRTAYDTVQQPISYPMILVVPKYYVRPFSKK